MKIVDFERKHIPEAKALAFLNYNEERSAVDVLPSEDGFSFPSLESFAENGLGVAALDGGKLIGFLCFFRPIDNAFSTTRVKGTFSPLHAHGAVPENRGLIYRLLYQTAAGKLVARGVLSHAVCLYAHDDPALKAFFTYGFGMRIMEAVRLTEGTGGKDSAGIFFHKLTENEITGLLGLENMLRAHLSGSPAFLLYPPQKAENMDKNCLYFSARKDGKDIAYLKACKDGENFISSGGSFMNICGAFCLPEYRGMGISRGLLDYLALTLNKSGYKRLGVDFESFNPNAYGFWLKYFSAYTISLVRRIDEKISDLGNIL